MHSRQLDGHLFRQLLWSATVIVPRTATATTAAIDEWYGYFGPQVGVFLFQGQSGPITGTLRDKRGELGLIIHRIGTNLALSLSLSLSFFLSHVNPQLLNGALANKAAAVITTSNEDPLWPSLS